MVEVARFTIAIGKLFGASLQCKARAMTGNPAYKYACLVRIEYFRRNPEWTPHCLLTSLVPNRTA